MQTLSIHPQNPQNRMVSQVCQSLKKSNLIACPTSHGHVLLLELSNKQKIAQAKQLAQQDAKEPIMIICQNISQISQLVELNNQQFKSIKTAALNNTAFLVTGNSNTPKYLTEVNKQILVQLTNTPLLDMIIQEIDAPLMAFKIHTEAFDIYELQEQIKHLVDIFIDDGNEYLYRESLQIIDITDA